MPKVIQTILLSMEAGVNDLLSPQGTLYERVSLWFNQKKGTNVHSKPYIRD